MSESASQFIDRIATQSTLNRKVDNVTRDILVAIASAVATVLSAIYFWKADEQPQQRIPHEQQLKFIRRKFMMLHVGNAAVALSIALLAYYTHRPSANETSLAILLKYMNLKGDLPDSVFSTLKNFKPHNIHALNV
tara:strand:- start:6 stop:413 length:408 start_codon:yes stop_codon:yes gene_type:complete